MPGSKSDYFAGEILKWVKGDTSALNGSSGSGTLYVALFTGTAPTEGDDLVSDVAGSELNTSETEYRRQAVTFNTVVAETDTGAGMQTSNNGEIDMLFHTAATHTATATYTITGWAIVDGGTAGTGSDNILYYHEGLSVGVSTGDSLKFADGALIIEED